MKEAKPQPYIRQVLIDDSDGAEAERRQAQRNLTAEFWERFAHATGEIERLCGRGKSPDPKRILALVEGHLEVLIQVDDRLRFDVGPSGDDAAPNLFSITCPGHRHVRPVIQNIIAAAPEIPQWRVAVDEPPQPLWRAQDLMEEVLGASLQGVTAGARLSEYGGIDIACNIPRAAAGRNDPARLLSAVAVLLLGETVVERFVDAIVPASEMEELGGPPMRLLPLVRLRGLVEALLSSAKEQLPREPFAERVRFDEDWHRMAALSINRKTGEFDRVHTPFKHRDAMEARVADSRLYGIQQTATADGPRFCSERFSACGEVFAYLRLAAPDGPSDAEAHERIAQAADALLREAGAGCVIGLCKGFEFGYVELAATELSRAANLLRARLDSGGYDCWIQCHDQELLGEWLAIRAAAPPPGLVE